MFFVIKLKIFSINLYIVKMFALAGEIRSIGQKCDFFHKNLTINYQFIDLY